MFNKSHADQLLALSPGCHKLFHGKRLGIRISGISVTPGSMIIRERPVNKIQINIGKSQILQALAAGFQHFSLSMHIVPYLTCDKQFLSSYYTVIKEILQNFSDLRLILIHSRAVNQAIAALHRSVYGIRNLISGIFIRPKCSEAYCGHFCSGIQPSFGNYFRIYPSTHNAAPPFYLSF